MKDRSKMTVRDQFESALKCKTKEEAAAWLEKEAKELSEVTGKSVNVMKSIITQNLGYFAGYYDYDTAQKIHQLFGAVHPVFGSADYHKTVSPESAFAKGKEMGAKTNGKHDSGTRQG